MRQIIAATFLLSTLACDPVEGDITLPDWSEGFPHNTDGGAVLQVDAGGEVDGGEDMHLGGKIWLTLGKTVTYATRHGLTVNQELPCAVDTSVAPFSQIDCQLDANELDLYAVGFAYDVKIPAMTCAYLHISNYMYQAWELGTGPAVVHYKVDAAGNFLSDVAASKDGKPFCAFDHSKTNMLAPNCCFGTFQTLVTVVDANGGETNRPLTPAEYWGGTKVGDCYAGAAYASNLTELNPFSGLPLDTLVVLDETADAKISVTFKSPLEELEASSVTVANYVEPGDAPPVGFAGTFAQPRYEVECLDHAREVTARIRLAVREWDEVAEFDKKGNANSGKKAMPNAARPLETNGSGSPINDYYDWSDFVFEGNPFVHFND